MGCGPREGRDKKKEWKGRNGIGEGMGDGGRNGSEGVHKLLKSATI